MNFEGEFTLPGTPQQVIERFTDIERMARCVPGATLDGQDDEGNYLGAIIVAFGPKRIRFRGKVRCEFDIPACTGTLDGRGIADARAARFEVQTRFHVTASPAADAQHPVSRVTVHSVAKLGGVLAAFAGAGGTAVGNVLMKDFAQNIIREYGDEPGSVEPASGVSAHRVVWSAMKDKAGRLIPGRSKPASNSGED